MSKTFIKTLYAAYKGPMKHTISGMLLFAVLLANVIISAAAPIDVRVVDIARDVEIGGVAKFKMLITNNLQDPTVFKITEQPYETAPFSKSIQKIKIEPNQIKIGPGETGSVNVDVAFTDAVTFGKDYSSEIKVASIVNPEMSALASLNTRVVNPNDVVQIVPEIPGVIVPGEEFKYGARFINRLNTKLEDYAIVISSELSALNVDERVAFDAKEEVAREYSKKLDVAAVPGSYDVRIGVYKAGSLKGAYKTSLTVIEKPLIEESKEEVKGFFKSTTRISKKNVGNTVSKQKVELSASWFKRMFFTSSLESYAEDGKLVWTATLNPGDEFTLEITTDYRMLFYGVIAIVIATLILLLYVDRSVTIKKRVLKVKSDEHGVTELKMLVDMRNGSGKAIEHVRVIDALPNFVELLPDFSTLKPDKLQQGERSMRMIWDIKAIAPREERVITYKVKARLHISGQIALPPASMHYMDGNTLVSVRSANVVYQP